MNRRQLLQAPLLSAAAAAAQTRSRPVRRCLFGIELPYDRADLFLTKPERFFATRLMQEGTVVPSSPYGPGAMAATLKSLGADFAGYDLHYDDPDATIKAAVWAREHKLGLMLNNPICQINAAPTPGFETWVYSPALVEEVSRRTPLLGLVYDELIHHQIHPGLKGHTNTWTAVAEVAGYRRAPDAYSAVEAGLRKIFRHTASTGIPVITEQVIPALFHGVARSGGIPGCKVLKEQITPISVSLCMSAARQYGTRWFGTVDLWGADSGPWYHIMGNHSAHGPIEYLNALKLMALLNPYAAMTESADVMWDVDSPQAAPTEFGDAFRHFKRSILPGIAPAFDAASWQPDIAFVRAEDACYQVPDNGFLLGCRSLPITPAASKWLRAWYHLTWGRCTGRSLWNFYNPLELEIVRRNFAGGNEFNIAACPPPSERRNPSRQETHMHSLFSPLNNVALFDAYVTPQHLSGVRLIVLCGSYCPAETQAAVKSAVAAGSICLCQEECAPPELARASGAQLGKGKWWTVPDFDAPAALEQFLIYRGYQNQWILRSALGTLRIHATDAWGNEIAWEIEARS